MDGGSRWPVEGPVLDAFPVCTAVVDSDGMLTLVNEAWTELGKRSALDIVSLACGDDFLAACEQSDSQAVTTIASDVRTVLQETEDSVTHVHPFDGTVADQWFLLRIAGFEKQGDRYALVLFIDVTELEDEHLTLREQIRRLEASISVISHDLQTPISVIRGNAALLEDEIASDSDALERIEEASARADTILDDALTLAQTQAVTERDVVDLADVVREVWDALEPVREQATLEIQDTVSFEASRGLLERLFENLFTNAFQHAGPDVVVRVGELPEPESTTVGFFVEDDGPGLPETALDEIFTPGYTTEPREGYGLGLTIVRAVAEAHGWAITATNGACGTRFEVAGIEPVAE